MSSAPVTFLPSARTITLPTGKVVPFLWKAVQIDGDCILWEVRRVATTFQENQPLQALRYMVKQVFPKVAEFWQKFGEDDCKILRSKLSVSRHGSDGDDAGRDESQVRTHTLMLYLIGCCHSEVRRGEAQAIASAALAALLEQLLPPTVLQDLSAALAFEPQHGAQCPAAGHGERCRHHALVSSILKETLSDGTRAPQRRLADLLIALPRAVVGCPIAMPWLRDLLRKAAAMGDQVMLSLQEYDPLKDPLFLEGASKRRRVDQDTREALTARLSREGRAHNVMGWGRLADAPDASCRRFRDHNSAELMAAGWSAFESARVVCIAADASRLLEPGKECLLSALFHCTEHIGWAGHIQVLRDFNVGMPGSTDSTVGQVAAELDWEDRLKKFVGMHDTGEPQKKQQALQRISNIDFGTKFDHILQCVGLHGLSNLTPPRHLRPLEANEERYWVEDRAVQCVGEGEVPINTKRSCIETDDGQRFFELPRIVSEDGTEWSPMRLHTHHDQGPVGWPLLTWAYKDMHVNGVLEPDRFHICHGGCKKAMQCTGLYALILSTTVVMKAKRGPFGGAGFLGSLSECVVHHSKVTGPSDPVFLFFYERMAHDLDPDCGHEYGSPSHHRKIFEKCIDHKVVHLVGQATKHARWFAWYKAYRETLQEGWWVLCWAICVYGIYKDWWSGPAAMEDLAKGLNMRVGKDGPGENDEAALSSSSAARSMQASAEELKVARGKFSHTLQFAGMVLMSNGAKEICDLAATLVYPIEEEQALSLTEIKTRRGGHNLYEEMACESHWQMLGKVVDECEKTIAEKRKVLGNLGRQTDEVHFRQVARCAMHVSLALVWEHGCSRMMYSHSPPFALVPLTSKDPARRQRALQYSKTLWDRLELLEARKRDGDRLASSMWRALVWPAMHFPREMLLQLAGCDFQHIPTVQVAEPMTQFARGWSGTKVIEDMVHIAKGAKVGNQSGKNGVTEVMHHIIGSDLLVEYDRPKPPPKSIAPQTRDAIAKSLKACSKTNLSISGLDEAALAHFGSSAYEAMSAQVFRGQGLATLSVVAAGDELEGMETQWMSLMASRGLMLQRFGSPDCWCVAGTSQYGALCLKLYPVKDTDESGRPFCWFSIVPLAGVHDDMVGSRFELIRVTDPKAWRSAELEALSPMALGKLKTGSKALKAGIVLKPTEARSLLHASAMKAFKGLSASRLPLLSDFLGIKFGRGERPRNEQGHLNVLLRHIFPNMDSESLDSIFELRGSYDDGEESDNDLAQVGAMLKVTDMKGCLEGVADADDEDEIGEVQEKHAKRMVKRAMVEKRRAQAKPAPKRRAGAGAAASSSGAVANADRVPKGGLDFEVPANCTEETLSSLLPGVAGCKMRLETHWHHRFHVTYPAPAPPIATSKTFTAASDMWDAAKHCIRWAWQRHVDNGGEPCPWEL